HGVPAGGAAAVAGAGEVETLPREGGGHVLGNGLLRVEIDERGLVVSVYDLHAERETVAPGQAANLLQLHPDFPNTWDAWDVDEFYRNTVTDLVDADEVAPGDEPGSVRVVRSFGRSRVTQVLLLPPGAKRLDIRTEVDWHETEKFLKLAFPLDLHADRYASESQYGHVYRATHTNTSWEAAKFEACNHRFIHLEEPGWGVALVNDSTYGHDVTRTVRESGSGTTTTVRASLLRAPRFPDPETDQGAHRFRHALVPGASIGDAVREGYFINLPERRVPGGGAPVEPLVSVDDDAVVVTAVKLADDESGDVVVRFHESRGGRARARLTAGFPLAGVTPADLLERPLPDAPRWSRQGDTVSLALRPFELVTLRLHRA
ncbi:glycoside hydrolase family 38 C-terminal domain-containing protein, partial [Nonomuraea lactucae]|uniref:glycoside hydrolase family 38 C-terminal domain-containing protein n=1 Tax=Nonomuraea lactucae TaxID=2249762 RepID=UPI001F055621